MRIVYRFWAIFGIATRRIVSQPWMALATTLGMVFAISLSMSVPLYASSVYNRIFFQKVGFGGEKTSASAYPPFSFLYTYDSNIHGNLNWSDLGTVDEFIRTQAGRYLGLPVKMIVRFFSTNPMSLFPGSVTEYPANQKPLMWTSVAFMSEMDGHVTVIEGEYPRTFADGPVEVMVVDELATELGMQVGEDYILFARNQVVDGAVATVSIPIHITGVFRPNDTREDYWFIRPSLLKDRIMVTEETYVQRISPLLSDEVYGAFWFFIADGSTVRPEQAMSLVNRIRVFQRQAEQALPKIRSTVSPESALFAYQKAANLLTLLLFAFSVPIFGLLLAFITMTAGMTVERQRNEIAVLRSRGAMILQMLGIAAVESLLLGLVAMAASLPVSAAITWMIASTRSFLDFSARNAFRLDWTPTSILFGAGAIGLTMLARLLPTIRAARDTIVMYKRERARSLRPPLWQRMGLDVLLAIPAGYGIYLLRQQGSIDPLNTGVQGDPFSNPLLILVPALAIFSLSLLFMRLLPWMMSAIYWVAAQTKSVGIMMAARHLARTPATYTLPLVLLILTLSLSAFTATLAGTLDKHLYDQAYYKIGADVTFLDLGDSQEDPMSMGPTPGSGPAEAASKQPGWFFIPVTEYLRIPGIQDVTRVGRYKATAVLGSSYTTGEILGVDRATLPGIAYWRSDFASASLGELMNRLAQTPDGILVPEAFAQKVQLSMNDVLVVRVDSYSKATEMDFHVVGTFQYFPTYYPGEDPLGIANLDYIFQEAGGEFPYSVWARAEKPVDAERMNYNVATLLGGRTTAWTEPGSTIDETQSRPERQGLFGVLSVGFAAAALLTVLGFLLYALLSFQRRFVELGVLRAMGLSAWQMTAFLASELAFLILTGGLIGTGLGVWISNLFIPYLQVGTDAASQVPPYVVYIAWPSILRVYALFGLLFVVALGTLVVLLRRMKIFQAIKMGETT